MKQSKGLNGYLKPEQKKTTNSTTMSPNTDIYSQEPTRLKQIKEGVVI